MLFYILPFIAYIVSSVPFGLIISKYFYKKDIRSLGSGNIGATNVARVCGKTPAFITFLLDFTKGIIVLLLLRYFLYPHYSITPSHSFEILICVGGILGHSFSIFLKFRGGKAVSVSFACLIFMYPLIALNLLVFWLIVLCLFRVIGIASTISAVFLFLISANLLFFFKDYPASLFLIFVACLIVLKHIPNIKDTKFKIANYAKS